MYKDKDRQREADKAKEEHRKKYQLPKRGWRDYFGYPDTEDGQKKG